MARRQAFGNVSKLPSGNYRARYRDPSVHAPQRGPWINAPQTFSTKSAAEAWLATVRSDVERGVWKHPDVLRAEQAAREREQARTNTLRAVTMADWAEAWLATQQATMAAGTVRKRRSNVKVHILPALGAMRLADLTPQVIAAWHSALPSDGVRTACYQTMRAMMNDAVASDETALTSNPCRVRGGGKSTAPRGERYLLKPEQVEALAEAIRPELRALVVLLADAGLRINEALALHRDCITLGKRDAFIDVKHSLVRSEGRLVLGPTKTNRSRRVQVMASTAQVLAEHLDRYAAPEEDGPVFPALGGYVDHFSYTMATKALRTAMADAGVVIPPGKYGGWHTFRHYSATRFGQAGASSAAIMQRYGWRKPEQALAYQRADADYEREMLDRMAALTSPTAETWSGKAEAARAAEAGLVNLESKRKMA